MDYEIYKMHSSSATSEREAPQGNIVPDSQIQLWSHCTTQLLQMNHNPAENFWQRISCLQQILFWHISIIPRNYSFMSSLWKDISQEQKCSWYSLATLFLCWYKHPSKFSSTNRIEPRKLRTVDTGSDPSYILSPVLNQTHVK